MTGETSSFSISSFAQCSAVHAFSTLTSKYTHFQLLLISSQRTPTELIICIHHRSLYNRRRYHRSSFGTYCIFCRYGTLRICRKNDGGRERGDPQYVLSCALFRYASRIACIVPSSRSCYRRCSEYHLTSEEPQQLITL